MTGHRTGMYLVSRKSSIEGSAAMRMGHMLIMKPRVCRESWWIDQPRQHFTKVAAQMTNTIVPVDDVSDREVAYYAQKQASMQALLGMVG
jgi:hypothetical protein